MAPEKERSNDEFILKGPDENYTKLRTFSILSAALEKITKIPPKEVGNILFHPGNDQEADKAVHKQYICKTCGTKLNSGFSR